VLSPDGPAATALLRFLTWRVAGCVPFKRVLLTHWPPNLLSKLARGEVYLRTGVVFTALLLACPLTRLSV
jgi:hypothetical protein